MTRRGLFGAIGATVTSAVAAVANRPAPANAAAIDVVAGITLDLPELNFISLPTGVDGEYMAMPGYFYGDTFVPLAEVQLEQHVTIDYEVVVDDEVALALEHALQGLS